ncbi:MAG: hypothetical protein WAV90_26250, partial [Gordonia amarae]
LHAELALVRQSLAPSADPGGVDEPSADRRVTVVTYPAGTAPEDVARQVARQLRQSAGAIAPPVSGSARTI